MTNRINVQVVELVDEVQEHECRAGRSQKATTRSVLSNKVTWVDVNDKQNKCPSGGIGRHAILRG